MAGGTGGHVSMPVRPSLAVASGLWALPACTWVEGCAARTHALRGTPRASALPPSALPPLRAPPRSTQHCSTHPCTAARSYRARRCAVCGRGAFVRACPQQPTMLLHAHDPACPTCPSTTCTSNTHAHTHAPLHTYTQVRSETRAAYKRALALTQTHMHACAHTHAHTHTCTLAHAHSHAHAGSGSVQPSPRAQRPASSASVSARQASGTYQPRQSTVRVHIHS